MHEYLEKQGHEHLYMHKISGPTDPPKVMNQVGQSQNFIYPIDPLFFVIFQ